jgi:hypothetical protein
MSRRRKRAQQRRGGSTAAYGAGAILLLGGVGVALYFRLRKRDGYAPSEPSEWALPSFAPRGAVEATPFTRGKSLSITDVDAIDYSVTPEEQAATEAALKALAGWRG